MIAYFPKPEFIPIAISKCMLNCKHCYGKFLRQMIFIDKPEKLLEFGKKFGGNGILISGGFDKNGKLINLEKMLPSIKKLKEKFYVAVHSGFVDKKMAEEIANACHIAFIDLPSANAIKNVIGLKVRQEDYFINMDKLIEAGIKVSPHITLGLNFGKIEENEILDEIKNYNIEKLILNIAIPAVKTEFENVILDEGEVIKFIKEAKRKVKRLAIGCMRPRSIDEKIAKVVREIALPSKKILKFVIEKKRYCCGVAETEMKKFLIS